MVTNFTAFTLSPTKPQISWLSAYTIKNDVPSSVSDSDEPKPKPEPIFSSATDKLRRQRYAVAYVIKQSIKKRFLFFAMLNFFPLQKQNM